MNNNNEKLTRAIRSLYRYAIILAGNYPPILLEQEEKILTECFKILNGSEILYIVGSWPELVKLQVAENKQISKDIKTLN